MKGDVLTVGVCGYGLGDDIVKDLAVCPWLHVQWCAGDKEDDRGFACQTVVGETPDVIVMRPDWPHAQAITEVIGSCGLNVLVIVDDMPVELMWALAHTHFHEDGEQGQPLLPTPAIA